MAQRGQLGCGDGTRLDSSLLQDRLDTCRIAHQCLVALAHRRHIRLDALIQHLLRIAPGHALQQGLTKRRGLGRAGEPAKDGEQRAVVGILRLAGHSRVGDDAHDRLAQLLLATGKQRNGVVVALGHLAAIQTGQRRHLLLDQRFGQHEEIVPVDMVETLAKITRHLDVLDLVTPDRHLVGIEGEDVRRHQHRIHVQTRVDASVRVLARLRIAVYRRLVSVRPVEHALGRHTGQKPGQLGNLGNVRLPIERHPLRVQPRRQPCGRNLQPRALDPRRVIALDQRVIVGHEVERIHIGTFAGLDGRADCAHVVAKMRCAGGGDASENSGIHAAPRG
jgi:hypothetical protein